MSGTAPRWLNYLEKKIGWIAVPQIAILIITLQVLGFAFTLMDPEWIARLALLPSSVLEGGEYWRLITFLALPLSTHPLWMLFVLWFLYFILTTLEREWGAFRTTFYVLFSILITIAYSLIFRYPVLQISHFESTLFLAAACLFPNYSIALFGILPVKMKWLAALTGLFIAIELLRGDWLDRFHLVAIYSNFILFFGPAAADLVRQALRRRKYRNQLRG